MLVNCNVKKTSVLIFTMMVICTVLLFGCGQKEASNLVKQSSKLETVTITLHNGDIVKVTDSTEIQDIVKVLNDAMHTKKVSTQDVPEADKYGKITLESKDGDRKMYYYEKKKKWYIEEPYVGIYQHSQNLNEYFSHYS